MLILSLLLVHEMDAIRAKEWKMFLVLKDMAEETACEVFILLHLPLYWGVLCALSSGGTAGYVLKIIVDFFLLGHAALHYGFREHAGNGFQAKFSKMLIYAMSALAFAHLCLLCVS